jgi:lipoprotein signal peptidase
MPHRTYRWLLITLAVVGLTADQVTKYRVFRWLYNDGQPATEYPYEPQGNGNSYDVVKHWFKLIAQFDPSAPLCDCGFSGLQTWSAPVMPRVNQGALFGMGGEHRGLANNVFTGISFLAAVAILVWGMQRKTARELWLMAALGLILGGTVGNLYDRLLFHGVRDFLYFYAIEWPVFNVADCCLVVGAGLLLVQAIFVSPPPEEAPAAAEVATPAMPEEPKA